MNDGSSGLCVNDLGVRYPGRREQALENVTLSVRAGEMVGVTGQTGAGKSTLALVAAGFVPRIVRARVTGRARLDGLDLTQAGAAALAGRVGIVFSTPALQLSGSKPTVREELAFGLENLGVPRSDMDERIDAALATLDIAHLAGREPLALSGGEQQRVAIASVLVMGTRVLVLDEPVAQLDPLGSSAVATALRQLANEGSAILLAEHDPDVLSHARRCVVLHDGRVVTTDVPARALGSAFEPRLGLRPPAIVVLAEAAGVSDEAAFDEAAIAHGLANYAPAANPNRIRTEPERRLHVVSEGGVMATPDIDLRQLVHRYADGIEAVRGISLTIRAGEALVVIGQNGSGKTTLVKHLNGLLRPTAGVVSLGGRDIGRQPVSELAAAVGFVFQNPDDQLFHASVEREVAFGPRNLGLDAERVTRMVGQAIEMLGLGPERATNPYDLPFSMRKLVALASVLAMQPPVLVLDEPTTGQDSAGRARVGAVVDSWAAAGRTVVAISHDMDFAARHFRRVVVMRGGEIVLDGPPATVFAASNWPLLASTGLRPPTAARIGALIGLPRTPLDADALLAMLGHRR